MIRFLAVALLAAFLVSCTESGFDVASLSVSSTFGREVRRLSGLGTEGLGLGSILVLSECLSDASADVVGTTAGLDCDGDGGVVAYQTPRFVKIALKSLYLAGPSGRHYVKHYEKLVDIGRDGILELERDGDQEPLPFGKFEALSGVTSLGMEIYYFQFKARIYGENREIRIYLSDDDFKSENMRGHHQGDITYFDSQHVEHWVKGGGMWFSDRAQTLRRGRFADGPGGTDQETGHRRGLVGDERLWNDRRMEQGHEQDIFVAEAKLSGKGTQLNLRFDVQNSLFYEDFGGPNSFDPCLNGSMEGCGGEWSVRPPKFTAEMEM